MGVSLDIVVVNEYYASARIRSSGFPRISKRVKSPYRNVRNADFVHEFESLGPGRSLLHGWAQACRLLRVR
jgi:hypothetical protein